MIEAMCVDSLHTGRPTFFHARWNEFCFPLRVAHRVGRIDWITGGLLRWTEVLVLSGGRRIKLA